MIHTKNISNVIFWNNLLFLLFVVGFLFLSFFHFLHFAYHSSWTIKNWNYDRSARIVPCHFIATSNCFLLILNIWSFLSRSMKKFQEMWIAANLLYVTQMVLRAGTSLFYVPSSAFFFFWSHLLELLFILSRV